MPIKLRLIAASPIPVGIVFAIYVFATSGPHGALLGALIVNVATVLALALRALFGFWR